LSIGCTDESDGNRFNNWSLSVEKKESLPRGSSGDFRIAKFLFHDRFPPLCTCGEEEQELEELALIDRRKSYHILRTIGAPPKAAQHSMGVQLTYSAAEYDRP
jgi:hypothetical protein